MKTEEISRKLKEKGLKVTPQRMVIMEAISVLKNHPTADNIVEYIRVNHPHISVGTVYNVLETMVDKGLISKVKTEKDIMRYDSMVENHHHLYCSESERIEDYQNLELNLLLEDFFKKHQISGFKIEDIKLQIIGKFDALSNK